ncbi:MAG: thiamine diphosphokinase [Lachnospiraceae bacterium]|nr:thiamine diphosphokinase [Lachnospiraceae bacterium]
MNTLIITGGQIDLPFAKQQVENGSWDCVISADSGLNFCREAGIWPDVILGDFDSADPDVLQYFREQCPERIRTFPAQKDETDTELAILHAIRAGADRITLLGATGSRLDHVLGNLQLLLPAMEAGAACLILDEHNRIRMTRDMLTLRKAEQFGRYVSLIPFTPRVDGLTLTGFVYETEDFTLTAGNARGVSNEIRDDEARIEMKSGILLVIESRD